MSSESLAHHKLAAHWCARLCTLPSDTLPGGAIELRVSGEKEGDASSPCSLELTPTPQMLVRTADRSQSKDLCLLEASPETWDALVSRVMPLSEAFQSGRLKISGRHALFFHVSALLQRAAQ